MSTKTTGTDNNTNADTNEKNLQKTGATTKNKNHNKEGEKDNNNNQKQTEKNKKKDDEVPRSVSVFKVDAASGELIERKTLDSSASVQRSPVLAQKKTKRDALVQRPLNVCGFNKSETDYDQQVSITFQKCASGKNEFEEVLCVMMSSGGPCGRF